MIAMDNGTREVKTGALRLYGIVGLCLAKFLTMVSNVSHQVQDITASIQEGQLVVKIL